MILSKRCWGNLGAQWLAGYLVLLFLGIIIAIRQPAFYMPDEGAHYLRIYEVSHLHLINLRDKVGVDIPCAEYVQVATKKYNPIAVIQQRALDGRFEKSCRVRSINTAGAYSFIPYVPAAIGMYIAERLGWQVEGKMITARITNFMVWFSIIFFGLLLIDRGRILVASFIMMPSFFWQLVALSADGATLVSCLTYIFLVIRIAQTERLVTPAVLVTLILLAVMVGASKGSYSPLTLLSYSLWHRMPEKSRLYKFIALGTPTVLACGIFLLLTGFADSSLIYLTRGANPALQWSGVIQNPLSFLELMLRAVLKSEMVRFVAPAYAVPHHWQRLVIMAITFVVLGNLLLYSNFGVSKDFRLLSILLTGIVLTCICLPLYLTYTPVGVTEILGLQERYYLPFIPLMFIAVCGNMFKERSVPGRSEISSFAPSKVDWILLIPLLSLMWACASIPSTVASIQ